ncbi:MAG: hypothetical protein DWQ06_09220 [Calditrichaeota bacterium]|nr:MAG: hypothetical protein DWQ06_09220 [Calditrichota bacterium]
MSERKKITIVGGGFAGVNSAILLSEKGFDVTLVESRKFLGGRVNSFQKGEDFFDNGQHLMLACYEETLKLFEKLGTTHLLKFYSKLEIDFYNSQTALKNTLSCPKLPAPFHLVSGILGISNLDFQTKFRMLLSGIGLLRKNKNLDEISISQWLQENFQNQKSIELFWKPIASAIMNFPIEKSSALVWENVLKTAFFNCYENTLWVLPKTNYQALFYKPALGLLEKLNCKVLLRKPVYKISKKNEKFEIDLKGKAKLESDLLLLTIPNWKIASILSEELLENSFFQNIRELKHSSILDATLIFEKPLWEKDFCAFYGGFLQWAFNKRRIWNLKSGDRISITFSHSQDLGKISNEEVIKKSLVELRNCFPELIDNKLLDFVIVRENKATFSPFLGQNEFRLSQKTPIENLFLAGDWTNTGFPSTIEGAVVSGSKAVQEILKSQKK